MKTWGLSLFSFHEKGTVPFWECDEESGQAPIGVADPPVCGRLRGVATWPGPNGPPPVLAPIANPMYVPIANHQYVWDATVDVIGDYFRLDLLQPVRLEAGTCTVGRIDTYPKISATILEPWDHDSVTPYDRWEATLQSMRKRAVVKIIPAPSPQGGFWIDLAILRELENLPQPERSTVGAATFHYDSSLTRIIKPEPVVGAEPTWYLQGRDTALEQRILGQLQYRLSPQGQPVRLGAQW